MPIKRVSSDDGWPKCRWKWIKNTTRVRSAPSSANVRNRKRTQKFSSTANMDKGAGIQTVRDLVRRENSLRSPPLPAPPSYISKRKLDSKARTVNLVKPNETGLLIFAKIGVFFKPFKCGLRGKGGGAASR